MSDLEKIGIWLLLWALALGVWWLRHRFHLQSRNRFDRYSD